jgi:4-amino-4-deoxy-L-arabinose transferase-like glycosyltransferase
MLSGQDWLDKPHFPFWITALSFKIFGINSFAYILPGFIFNLIGAYYTYKLANYLYKNQDIALLSTLIYLTIFHLMISAIDVRAEAYLLGQIIPAVYYWLNYDDKFSWKYLLLGAFFTGLALMTKGIFVVITIVSGI